MPERLPYSPGRRGITIIGGIPCLIRLNLVAEQRRAPTTRLLSIPRTGGLSMALLRSNLSVPVMTTQLTGVVHLPRRRPLEEKEATILAPVVQRSWGCPTEAILRCYLLHFPREHLLPSVRTITITVMMMLLLYSAPTFRDTQRIQDSRDILPLMPLEAVILVASVEGVAVATGEGVEAGPCRGEHCRLTPARLTWERKIVLDLDNMLRPMGLRAGR